MKTHTPRSKAPGAPRSARCSRRGATGAGNSDLLALLAAGDLEALSEVGGAALDGWMGCVEDVEVASGSADAGWGAVFGSGFSSEARSGSGSDALAAWASSDRDTAHASADSADAAVSSDALASAAESAVSDSASLGAATPLLVAQPMLRRGSDGDRVRLLQRLLNELSGAGLTIDGDFGLRTHRAVRAYQSANWLSPDGVVGPATAAKLNEGRSAPATATTQDHADSRDVVADESSTDGDIDTNVVVTGSPVLKKGMRGVQVEAVQRMLNQHGAGLIVDGDYGTLTVNAVMGYQRANGLEVDGKVGPGTARSLSSGTGKDIAEGGFEGMGAYKDARDAVIAAAESHLGKPYYWGGDGPNTFDCSGFVLYVLRQETGLVDWGDDTAAGIAGRVPSTGSPQRGDLVFYRGSNGITHIEFYLGSGSQTLGCSGGGSRTRGDDPDAKVQYGDYSSDGRSKSFGSIQALIERSQTAAAA